MWHRLLTIKPPGRTYQGLAVRQETNSVPVSPTSLLPRTSIYGAGLGAELGVRAGAGAGPSAPPSAPPSITFADSIPSGYPSAAGLLPAARIPGYCGPRVDTSDQFMEFVNNVLVPHVENLNFSASSSPTRASCKEHLRRVLDSIAASAEKELDKRERRRSSGAGESSTTTTTSSLYTLLTHHSLQHTQLWIPFVHGYGHFGSANQRTCYSRRHSRPHERQVPDDAQLVVRQSEPSAPRRIHPTIHAPQQQRQQPETV